MIKDLWNKVSYLGVEEGSEHPDDKTAVVGNQVIFLLTISLTILTLIFLLSPISFSQSKNTTEVKPISKTINLKVESIQQ